MDQNVAVVYLSAMEGNFVEKKVDIWSFIGSNQLVSIHQCYLGKISYNEVSKFPVYPTLWWLPFLGVKIRLDRLAHLLWMAETSWIVGESV